MYLCIFVRVTDLDQTSIDILRLITALTFVFSPFIGHTLYAFRQFTKRMGRAAPSRTQASRPREARLDLKVVLLRPHLIHFKAVNMATFVHIS